LEGRRWDGSRELEGEGVRGPKEEWRGKGKGRIVRGGGEGHSS